MTLTGGHQQDVLAFFDQMIVEGTRLNALVTRSAAYLDCAVGIRLTDGTGVAKDPDGSDLSCLTPAAALRAAVVDGGEAWLARPDGPREGDEFALRRFVVAARAVSRNFDVGPGSAAQISPLETLVEGAVTGASASVALRRLNLRASEPIRVVVVIGAEADFARFVPHLVAMNRVVAHAGFDRRHVVLVAIDNGAPVRFDDVPTGLRVAQSRTFEAQHIRDAYLSARMALRFALASPRDKGPYTPIDAVFANAENVGCFEVLTTLLPDYVSGIDDIKALDQLVTEHGTDILRVLEAYAATESLRKAAAQLFMHHNSVSYWVRKAERVLGFQTDAPYRRARLMLALCLRRSRDNSLEL
ncbi:helix-turn-helix domain-containing protein [Pseudonocardia lacus]|uniref:helix-turn-helix domain-containing protein n=1 Tax=Pseudonocardia lacus TaxID=2835865 RepID=UPI001BDD6C3F|nr:helix-turn-helix domain-containing protein [Pseudonocardia lacus]